MKEQLDKLIEYWNDFDYLSPEEWRVFKYQMELIMGGKTWDEVSHLSAEFDE